MPPRGFSLSPPGEKPYLIRRRALFFLNLPPVAGAIARNDSSEFWPSPRASSVRGDSASAQQIAFAAAARLRLLPPPRIDMPFKLKRSANSAIFCGFTGRYSIQIRSLPPAHYFQSQDPVGTYMVDLKADGSLRWTPKSTLEIAANLSRIERDSASRGLTSDACTRVHNPKQQSRNNHDPSIARPGSRNCKVPALH